MVGNTRDREECAPEAHSPEPSVAIGVEENSQLRRAPGSGASPKRGAHYEAYSAKKPGRPKKKWRLHIVRIDARKYPGFQGDRDHPFASMAAEARTQEIDSFCARLWARTKKPEPQATGQIRPAAHDTSAPPPIGANGKGGLNP
jgi:hypothetical protein